MRTRTGVVLMAGGTLLLPLVDGAAKHLGSTHSAWMIGWSRYAVAAALLLPVVVARRGWLPSWADLPGHLLRTALLTAAMSCYFLAIQEVPLVTAVTAYFVGPIVATLLGVVLLREPLTSTKVLSLVGGVVGALLVVGPGGHIEPGVLLALAAGGFYAVYLVATRRSSTSTDPVTTLVIQCVLATVLLTPAAAATWSAPSADEIWLFVTLGGLSLVCQGLVIAALGRAEASTLAPLVYLELAGAVLVGLVFFHDVPDAHTVAGSLVIVGAGLVLTSTRLEIRRWSHDVDSEGDSDRHRLDRDRRGESSARRGPRGRRLEPDPVAHG